ncbi:hypothetical protein BJX96DRAFT_24372 [Aspergillus floccosus]
MIGRETRQDGIGIGGSVTRKVFSFTLTMRGTFRDSRELLAMHLSFHDTSYALCFSCGRFFRLLHSCLLLFFVAFSFQNWMIDL